MLVRSIEPSDMLSWNISHSLMTPGEAPTSRSQSPTLMRSSRLRSGNPHGSSGSIEVSTLTSAASTSSCDARSAAVHQDGQSPTSTESGTWRVISPGLRDVRRGQGQPELLDQPEVAGVGVADDLAAELDAPTVGELDLLDATADPGPGLEHRDLRAAGLEVARGGEAGQAGPHDHDVGATHRSTVAALMTPAAPSNRAGAGSGPSWPTRTPTVVAMHGPGLRDPEVGVPGEDPSAEAVGERDRRLGDRPRVEGGVEDPGGDALADDVGHGGVEVLVEVGADLGEVRVPDAQQRELLPQQPLVRALLVAGQAPVEERREPLGGPVAGVGQRALVELGRDLVGVPQHLAEEELLGLEVVVQQAGRDPGGTGDRGHADLGQAVADDAVGGSGQDPGPCLRGRLLTLAGPGRGGGARPGAPGRGPRSVGRHVPHLSDCSVSQ